MKKQNKQQKKLPLERKLVRRLIDLRKSELDQAAGGRGQKTANCSFPCR